MQGQTRRHRFHRIVIARSIKQVCRRGDRQVIRVNSADDVECGELAKRRLASDVLVRGETDLLALQAEFDALEGVSDNDDMDRKPTKHRDNSDKSSADGGSCHSRRAVLRYGASLGAAGLLASPAWGAKSRASDRTKASVEKGLQWVARTQSKNGRWTANNYPAAMTALAGTALLCSGSTTTQGPYAKNIRRAVDYLVDQVRENGLIGDPDRDNRYTYGHGFSMLFLSQVLGEEEDADRRRDLVNVLTKAAQFSGKAQTRSGGWGYVSAKDGNNFDEGSTTITQVQGLRGCRNAGIPVSGDVIDRAKKYIYKCKNKDGGISYSFSNRGSSRPAITAAALAALFNAGDYDSKHVPEMMKYCKDKLYRLNNSQSFGHWHYTYLYYGQVVYREGGETWRKFRDNLYARIVGEQQTDGQWTGNIGPIYVTAINLTVLQLENGFLPIYQR